jgi:hypothetical protein
MDNGNHKRKLGEIISLHEVERRLSRESPSPRLELFLPGVNEYGMSFPDEFCGAACGERDVFVGFTRRERDHREKLGELLPNVPIKIFRGRYSHAEIVGRVRDITADMQELRRKGIGVTGVGIARPWNVVISLLRLDEVWIAYLQGLYGDDLAFDVQGFGTPS